MLARSLMRDVALAGSTDDASATNAHAAHNRFALRMPGIPTLPWKFAGLRDTPMTRGPPLAMRAPCHALLRNQWIDFVRKFARRAQPSVHVKRSESAVCGRFCRAIYASLTIKRPWFRPGFLVGHHHHA